MHPTLRDYDKVQYACRWYAVMLFRKWWYMKFWELLAMDLSSKFDMRMCCIKQICQINQNLQRKNVKL